MPLRASGANGSLARLHLGTVVVAQEVEKAVRERRAPGVADDLRAEDDVAELAGNAGGERVAAVDREREHVGRLVDAQVLALQRAALVRADERDPELAVLDPLGCEHAAGVVGGGSGVDLEAAPVGDLDLDH